MQGLCFNISLLFLHTKDSGYIDSPLLNTLVIHGMIETFTAMLTKRGKITFLNYQFRFVFHRVGFRLHHNANNNEIF